MLGTNYDRLHGSIVHIALISLDSQFYPLVQVLKDFYINLQLTVTTNQMVDVQCARHGGKLE